jgi:hypothetical protein
MMHCKILFLLIAATLIVVSASAQSSNRIYTSAESIVSGIKVTENNVEKQLAWSGGLNTPQFALADLNKDGLKDLVIYEYSYKIPGVKTFINKGTAGNAVYKYAPEYQYKFPATANYIKLYDFNCDGAADLFTGSSNVYVYFGYYDTANILSFKEGYDVKVLYENNNVGSVGLRQSDIPGFEDIDGDGDIDVVCFYHITDNGLIQYYRNDGQPCDSIELKHKDVCWGKVRQFGPREHLLHFTCNNDALGPKTSKTTDGTNSFCLFDADGDTDMDVLVGNKFYADIQYLHNGRIPSGHPRDTMLWQDTTWQSGGKKLYMPDYPMGHWVDIDLDGDRDMIISPLQSGENYKVVAYYKNTGTTSAPVYTYQSDTFLVDQMIDLGSNSFPLFYDYNKDGKKDLFIGAKGFYNNGLYKPTVFYLENTSVGNAVSFNLVNRNFLNVNASPYQGASLAIGDLDNDGKDEFLIGHLDGTISYYTNSAASGSVQPVWVPASSKLKDNAGNVIAISGNVAPFIYDMDKDGKKDLIIGNATGYLSFYKNASSGSGIFLQFVTNKLGDVKIDPNTTAAYVNSVPYIGPVDNTEKDYLVIGSERGFLYRYDGFQNGNLSSPFTLVDSQYSDIRIAGSCSAPAFADLDNDKMYELFIGNDRGGLFVYKQIFPASVDYAPLVDRLSIFPNPADRELHIKLDRAAADQGYISIYNSMGRLMTRRPVPSNSSVVTVDISGFAPGMYLCSASFDQVHSAIFIKK